MLAELECSWVSLPVGDAAAMSAFVARPKRGEPLPAVIVGMELFGVTPHIRQITERLAQLGFVAIAPDFYHRDEERADLGYDDSGRKRGFELLASLDREKALADVRATMAYLERTEGRDTRVAFVGFSIGGHIAYLAATQLSLVACAAFYPGWLTTTGIAMSQPSPTLELTAGISPGCNVTLFVGETDHLVQAGERAQIEGALTAARVEHDLVIYPGVGHGFFCDERSSFDQAAHDDAWNRVSNLLNRKLAGKPD